MSMVEDQDILGRSRSRNLKKYGNLSGTRSSSIQDTFNESRENSRTRKVPATILYNHKPTNKEYLNSTIQPIDSNNNINLSPEKFTQSEYLMSSDVRLSPDLHNRYQHNIGSHKMSPRIKRTESPRRGGAFQSQHSEWNYGKKELVDNRIGNNSLLENLPRQMKDLKGQEGFYKYGNPDNPFRNFQSTENNAINHVHSDLSYGSDNRTTISTPSSTIASAANKIYNRVSQLFNGDHNSLYSLSRVSSCYTLKGNERPNDNKIIKENSLDASIKAGSVDHDSGLDNEDSELDEEFEPENTHKVVAELNTDKWESTNNMPNYITDNRSVVANTINYKEVLQDINDFQRNFVKKYDNSIPPSIGDPGPKNTSRTLQKVLDYKDLYSEEEVPSNSGSNLNLSSKWHSLAPGNTSVDYGVKIQHEAIMAEYTQIKLRFSSSISGSSSETYSIPNEKFPSKLQMKSKTGVLGFIDRSKYLRSQDNIEKEHDTETMSDYAKNDETNHHPATVNFENKDEYLSKLWQREVEHMFPMPSSVPLSTTHTHSPDLKSPRKKSIDLRSENCDIYKNRTDNSHIGTKSIDLSQMARSVRFKR